MYTTTVRAEVYLTIQSDTPLEKTDVHEFLSEVDYHFGSDEGITVESGATAHVTGTRWEDNEITYLNEEFEDA